jgi:hypothetical protein
MVAVTETGGSEICAGGVPDEAHSAALLVVNPAEAHSSRMNGSGRWQYRSFYLERAAVADVLPGLGISELPGLSRNMLKDGDLIGGSQPHQMKVIDHDDHVRQRSLHGGPVNRARVDSHEPDLVLPAGTAVLQPAGDCLAGPPGHLAQQSPRPEWSVKFVSNRSVRTHRPISSRTHFGVPRRVSSIPSTTGGSGSVSSASACAA